MDTLTMWVGNGDGVASAVSTLQETSNELCLRRQRLLIRALEPIQNSLQTTELPRVQAWVTVMLTEMGMGTSYDQTVVDQLYSWFTTFFPIPVRGVLRAARNWENWDIWDALMEPYFKREAMCAIVPKLLLLKIEYIRFLSESFQKCPHSQTALAWWQPLQVVHLRFDSLMILDTSWTALPCEEGLKNLYT